MTLQAVSVKKSRIDTFAVLALDARAEQLTEKQLRHWKETHEFAVENSSYQSDVDSDVFTIFCSNKIHMISCVGKRTEL